MGTLCCLPSSPGSLMSVANAYERDQCSFRSLRNISAQSILHLLHFGWSPIGLPMLELDQSLSFTSSQKFVDTLPLSHAGLIVSCHYGCFCDRLLTLHDMALWRQLIYLHFNRLSSHISPCILSVRLVSQDLGFIL